MIAVQNFSASLYSISIYQIKFPPPQLDYYIFKNFLTPCLFQSPPLRLLSFEEFSNLPPPHLFQPPSIWHSRVITQVPNQAST